jgi:predicted dehydrogenase
LEGESRGLSVETEEPLTAELKAFLDSIRSRSRPLADGQAGYEALKIVETCYESSRRGKKLEIEWKKA